MMRRLPGLLLIAFAIVYAVIASGYVVTFVADPLGPRAAPFLLAALLVLLGAWLAARPETDSSADDASPNVRLPRSTPLAVVTFLAYGTLLPWIGFVLATALLCGVMARLADGPALRATATGVVFAGTLYYLFVFALDVPLPIGRIFPFLGG